MHGPGPASSRGRWPSGLLGMVVLVVAVESAVAGHRFDFLNAIHVTWAMGGREVDRLASTDRVLCFGDSLLKFGFRPEVIERRSGVPAFNLAVIAGRAPCSYFLLRRALDAGARPSAVLVDYEPNILAQSPIIGPDLWAELAGPFDCAELAWAARDGDFLVRTLLARYLPTTRYRAQIRGAILRALGGRPSDGPADRLLEIPSIRRDTRLRRGSVVMPHVDRAPVAADPGNTAFFPPDWRCDPINRRYVRKFFELANAHQIPVFWVLPPYAPPVQSLREKLGQDASFTSFAEGLRSKYPNVTVLDGRRSGYDHSVFWDGTVHLDGQGAATLSADLGDVLKRSISGESIPRWVGLPGGSTDRVAGRDRPAGAR